MAQVVEDREAAEKVDAGEIHYSAVELSRERTELTLVPCEPKFRSLVVKLDNFLSGTKGKVISNVFILVAIWAALATVTKQDSLPGGNLFGLLIVFVCAVSLGILVSHIPYLQLPSLLGMLVAGIILTNVDAINVTSNIDGGWSVSLRNIALVVILLRSGLELDPDALKRLKWTVLRLAFGPCLTEALTVTVVAYFLLDLPWLWGLQLGFVLGAVSPAIVVPQLLDLQENGYGIDQGIPTLVMAASSCDDVLAISLFTVFLGISFSKGNIVFNIFRGPLELFLGIVIGCISGCILTILPSKHEVNSLHGKRFIFLLSFGIMLLFGSNWLKFSGAGALGVLITSFVAAHGWGVDGKIPVINMMDKLWMIFEPLMFGLIGAEIKIEFISANLIGLGLATLTIGLLFRVVVTYFLTFGNNLNVKEKLFICIAWLPKATVQAAIGAISLATARNEGYSDMKEEDYGIKILTLAVLVILLTAPLGAVGIAMAGPKLLSQSTGGVNESAMDIEEKVGLTSDKVNEETAM